MPKASNKIDYTITPISFYKFCCNDANIKSSYVGHTSNFTQRKYCHKNRCKDDKYNFKIYETIRANGGWNNWVMVEIENKICLSKRDAGRHEQQLTDEINADMNMIKSFTSETYKKEYNAKYQAEHADKIKEYNAKYRAEHPDKIKEYQTNWYIENADKIKEYNAKYRAEHPDKIKEYRASLKT
jgi:hypothetical protein